MLNLNQLKEREDLMAQQAKLGDELAFAEENTLPWGGLELEPHQHGFMSGAWRLRAIHAGG